LFKLLRRFFSKQINVDPIVIVSGLPRSGTSMMMKILEAGGMSIATDNIREADEDNPKGYYELEKVKKLKIDNTWLGDIAGMAVKMISMLLYDLPARYSYKIIFMRRKLEEVLASQKRMLERHDRLADYAGDDEMRELYGQHLEEVERWLGQQDNIEVVYVNYKDFLEAPVENVKRLNESLGGHLDESAMAEVVDSQLYRQRK
jgi:hypothetical protein